MATVIVFSLPALGHVHPTLPIVAELVRRGDRVIYYCSEDLRAVIQAQGAEFRPVPVDFSGLNTTSDPRLVELALVTLRCTEAWMPRLLEEVREANPRYLLVDFMCVWGRYAARSLGLPLALLSSSFAIGPGLLPPKPVMMALDIGPSLRRVLSALELRRIGGRLASRYKVDPIRLPMDLLSMDGDIVLATTSREFQPHAERFGEHFHFVGPCFEPRGGEQPWTPPPLDERPLVYVSLGTVFNRKVEFFKNCLKAFSDGRYQVIMSIGRRLEPAVLGPLPPHVHVFNYVPQLEVLRRAALFVTHGGMNSTSEGLSHEVPLLVVPQAADQFAIASQVEKLGLGRQLRPWQRRAAHVRKAVDELLADPAVRERCREMRRSFVEAGGARRAADILQAFPERRPVPRA
jgi:MGT family glycosyltransferase